VQKVFDWFVHDRFSIRAIVQGLNADPAAPRPPKSPNRSGTHQAVRALLGNTRYRGLWRYGVTESVWVSSKDYVRKDTRREPLKEAQVEELRMVSDVDWF